jgi:hypothetical protein
VAGDGAVLAAIRLAGTSRPTERRSSAALASTRLGQILAAFFLRAMVSFSRLESRAFCARQSTSATSFPEDAVRNADHTASQWLDLAERQLRLDRLSRNGGRSDFLPLTFGHSSRGKKVYRRHPPLRSGPPAGASSIAFGLPITIEAAVVAGSKQLRRSDMANIGSFKKSGSEFQGEIVTLSVQTKGVRIVPETSRANDNAPSHRVYVGRADYV